MINDGPLAWRESQAGATDCAGDSGVWRPVCALVVAASAARFAPVAAAAAISRRASQ